MKSGVDRDCFDSDDEPNEENVEPDDEPNEEKVEPGEVGLKLAKHRKSPLGNFKRI